MFDDLATRLANTKVIKERQDFEYIADGTHTLQVIEMVPYKSEKHGPSVRATFEVIESTAHEPGSRVSKVWALNRPANFAGGETDLDRLTYFVRRIAGIADNENPSEATLALIQKRVAEQLLRGMIVKCAASTKVTKNNKRWFDVKWTHVEQTQADIAARRAELDTRHPLSADAKVTPAPAPTPAAPAAAAAPAANLLSQIPGFGK